MRIFSLGLVKGKDTYLLSGWNILDFFLVIFSWVYMLLQVLWPERTFVNPSVLRIIRCLRPLRTAGFVQGVQSALQSWPYLLNLLAMLVFTLTMYGVLGVQMFGGALTYQCLGDFPSGAQDDSTHCSLDSSAACNECVAANSLDQCTRWGVDCSCYNVRAPEPEPEEAAEFALQLLAEQQNRWLELNRSATRCPRQLSCANELCVPGSQMYDWGFDNIATALLSCWITTTGDQWAVEMLPVMAASPSSFQMLAWPYFISQAFILHLIVSNLFAAVIVHSFLEDAANNTDRESLEHKIRKERTLFNRMDADGSGEISVGELTTIVEILDLEDTADFADYELEEAKCV